MPQSILHPNASILAAATVVGSKEQSGPLGGHFDYYGEDDRFGQNTWERAESEMQRMAMAAALDKAGFSPSQVDMLFAGDLLNQCVGSSYGLLSYDIPYFGLYGACSTSAEGLLLASAMIGGGQAKVATAVTSSHNAAAERQFRSPLEYGGQRPPTGQWTVTGAGAFVLEDAERSSDPAVVIRRGLPGKAMDFGINDANNMGAAMAPAALDTLTRFFRTTGERPEHYDRIVTGDLGFEGGEILCSLMEAEGFPIRERYDDCGRMIYDRMGQDVHCGGSGCGCAAVVLGAHLVPSMLRGELSRILFLATGAMMSPDSIKQGQNIPSIAHLLELEFCERGRG